MQVFAGTSGFSIDEWQGRFYPKGLNVDARLSHYSSRLHSVEINNSFYQMPKASLLERWRDTVPDGFRFALKAPRRFTHSQRLRLQGDAFEHFLLATGALVPKLGPVLFQLPPFLRKDAPLLADFLQQIPSTLLVAFEFRHPSWFDDEIFALLASKNVALCGGDSDERGHSPPFVATANFGYLRLRAPSYDANALREWARRILAEPFTHAYVYMKHEVLGPEYALFLDAVVSGAPEPLLTRATDSEDAAQTPAATPKKGIARAKPRIANDPDALAPTAMTATRPKKGLVRAKPHAATPSLEVDVPTRAIASGRRKRA
ncbi:MAG TPA: DUF72 domain-containing protein [Polyangiaceae bacterium]